MSQSFLPLRQDLCNWALPQPTSLYSSYYALGEHSLTTHPNKRPLQVKGCIQTHYLQPLLQHVQINQGMAEFAGEWHNPKCHHELAKTIQILNLSYARTLLQKLKFNFFPQSYYRCKVPKITKHQ